MAKRYTCRPVLRPGKSVYSTTMIDFAGRRRTISLRVSELDKAQALCDDLVKLRLALPSSEEDAPVDVDLDAVALYFGKTREAVEALVFHSHEPRRALVRGTRGQDAAGRLRMTVARLTRELHAERARREALERSVLGQLATAGAECPPMAEAFARFKQHLQASVSSANAQDVVSAVERFLEQLPPLRLRPVDITDTDVKAYLDAHVEAAEDGQLPAMRRSGMRKRVGRFLNWAASEWKYPSPMQHVPAVGTSALEAERGDIVWHSEADIEAAIEALPDDYWKAAVATLAYAGLNPVELCWLKVEHLQRAEDFGGDAKVTPARFWVTVVEDPAGKEGRRRLKTGNRRRHVNIHPTRLWPRLQTYLDAGLAGTHFLFPVPKDKRRKRTKSQGHRERWLVRSFRKVLIGHARGEKKDTPGLLPAGMNAETLRHTFGSIRLRDGRTTAEVAAEMGNTEEVVRSNYARILGWEVKP